MVMIQKIITTKSKESFFLKEKCIFVHFPVSFIIEQHIEDMIDTLYSTTNGIGLAATQVGLNISLAIVDLHWLKTGEKNPFILINPRLTGEGIMTVVESCLSLPGQTHTFIRYKKIKVEYQNIHGNIETINAERGLFCQALQHEIEHLNGILIEDK